ncbi:hypothetical protein C2G38_2231888 [Gigaspora rosea]|uniref:Uncharacterized protein n=1 Tax=Gigaspora rosea TaxID=44941 RepID=A0A397TUK9_9GLOM|nr:hypothetical protein C2G38_2231888 [Gigaspora rosea]
MPVTQNQRYFSLLVYVASVVGIFTLVSSSLWNHRMFWCHRCCGATISLLCYFRYLPATCFIACFAVCFVLHALRHTFSG